MMNGINRKGRRNQNKSFLKYVLELISAVDSPYQICTRNCVFVLISVLSISVEMQRTSISRRKVGFATQIQPASQKIPYITEINCLYFLLTKGNEDYRLFPS